MTLTAKIVPEGDVVRAPRAALTEVEPGVLVAPASLAPAPPLSGTWRAMPRPDLGAGLMETVLELRPAYIPLSEWHSKRFGCGKHSIMRLVLAGFVRHICPTPGSISIDLHSYYAHVDATRTDPFFWNEERLETFARARALYENRSAVLRTRLPNGKGREIAAEVQRMRNDPNAECGFRNAEFGSAPTTPHLAQSAIRNPQSALAPAPGFDQPELF